MTHGISDAEALFSTMCFVFLSNLIGNPAISVCNGYDAKTGLPTALQIMSNHGCEEGEEKQKQKQKEFVFSSML